MGGILSEPAIFSGVQVLSTRHRLPTLFLRSGAAEMTCVTNILRLLAEPPKSLLFTTKEGGPGMGSRSAAQFWSSGGRIWLKAKEP